MLRIWGCARESAPSTPRTRSVMEAISLAKASACAGVCLRFNKTTCAAAFALSSCCKERSRSSSELSTP